MSPARLLLPAALLFCPVSQDVVDVPTVQHAVPDTPVPDQFRPVLDIRYDGKITHAGELLYDPEVHDILDDPFEKLREFLSVTAKRMERDYIDKKSGAGPRIPDEPILLRPDRSVPFRYVQKCMENCGSMGVQIWKVQLACRTPEGAEGRLAAYLPKDVGVNAIDAEPVENLEVVLRVRAPGTKLDPSTGEAATVDTGRFVYGDGRQLEYLIGPYKTKELDDVKKRLAALREARVSEDEVGDPVTIDARPGTIYQDVTAVLDAILGAGFTDVTFVGAYEFEEK